MMLMITETYAHFYTTQHQDSAWWNDNFKWYATTDNSEKERSCDEEDQINVMAIDMLFSRPFSPPKTIVNRRITVCF